MVIAELLDPRGWSMGRVYLSTVPTPGDTVWVRSGGGEVVVLHRTFLDLGPEGGADDRLSIQLKVKPL